MGGSVAGICVVVGHPAVDQKFDTCAPIVPLATGSLPEQLHWEYQGSTQLSHPDIMSLMALTAASASIDESRPVVVVVSSIQRLIGSMLP
jgi:hypothetical protein